MSSDFQYLTWLNQFKLVLKSQNFYFKIWDQMIKRRERLSVVWFDCLWYELAIIKSVTRSQASNSKHKLLSYPTKVFYVPFPYSLILHTNKTI